MSELKLYEALYNDCVHESAYATISIHLTKREAEEAIEKHKVDVAKSHFDGRLRNYEDWKISTTRLNIKGYALVPNEPAEEFKKAIKGKVFLTDNGLEQTYKAMIKAVGGE